jgi:hypothetical protein
MYFKLSTSASGTPTRYIVGIYHVYTMYIPRGGIYLVYPRYIQYLVLGLRHDPDEAKDLVAYHDINEHIWYIHSIYLVYLLYVNQFA